MKNRGNAMSVTRATALAALALIAITAFFLDDSPAQAAPAKNVIVLIADGTSIEQYTLARWFKGQPLALDRMRVCLVKTHSADSVIPDSAPAATAYATGVRTSDRMIGVGPHENTLSTIPKPDETIRNRPLATVLEGARIMGKSTGIVATCRVSHATPAAFMAHVPSREMEDDIMEQAVYGGVDVVFGGGRLRLAPKDAGGSRLDGENLVSVLAERGYRIAETAADLKHLTSAPVFGLFAPNHMEPEIDRPANAPSQPTLEEMARKAIEVLSKDPDGFFLMIEASQVDWACHANDPAHLLSDLLMFDKAVEVALDFARKDGKTLVMALSDHNTGGMSIGSSSSDISYKHTSVENLLGPLKSMKKSSRAMWMDIAKDKTPEKVKQVVLDSWGVEIGNDEASQILELGEIYKSGPFAAIGKVVCPKHTLVGWTSHGHTGGDVPLFAYGPGSPEGTLDAPDVGRITADALGFDLQRLNGRLFVDAGAAFGTDAATLDKSDPNNPVLRIEFNGTFAELPVNKNILKLRGRTILLEGVTVHAPNTGKTYIPMQAELLIEGKSAAPADIANKPPETSRSATRSKSAKKK